MARYATMALLLMGLFVLGTAPLMAEEKADAPAPAVDSEDVVAEALETFKTEFKAKGLRGDDKIAQKVFAIKQLADVQHPDIIDRLAKLSRMSGKGNSDVRTAAVQYLGKQKALPGKAGFKVVEVMKRNNNDSVLLISGLQSMRDLQYQAASELLRELMKHKDYSVQKATMEAIGELGDMRLLKECFQLLKEIKKAKGESWDGVSVSVDTGTAGTADQEAAEALGKAQMAKNKRKGRRGARSQRDMGPLVEAVLKKLTGEVFEKEKDARDWMKENDKDVKAAIQKLDDIAKQQIEAAKAR